MDYFGAAFEIKTVDVQQRIIAGRAAVHSNLDRVRDIIDPAASVKAVRRLRALSDVAVFIGHEFSNLPVGIPQKIEALPDGLYTETYVLKGPAGDNLLAVATDLEAHGQALGMSIGYVTQDARPERVQGKMARRIMDYQLREYSFAAPQIIANPQALVNAVKARHKALSEGSDGAGGMLVPPDEKGGSMQYRVEQRNGKWLVLCDADADGDEDDNRVIGSYDSQEMANAVALALRNEAKDVGDMDDDAKTSTKAAWTGSYVSTLPDSSFLFIESGGEKDSEGKTVPRSLRHFPYRDASGKVDAPHLRNAIARIPQSNARGLDAAAKAELQARARRLLETADSGKTADEALEWKTSGAPLSLRALGYQLLDLSEQVAEEQQAMRLLGEDTKGGSRVRASVRDEVKTIIGQATRLVEHAERIEAGEDGKARMAYLKAQFAMTEF